MENRKMTLKGYYDGLSDDSPKTSFVKRVAKRCDVSEQTVRNWTKGLRPQKYNSVKVLEEETGIKEDDLWA